MGQVSGKFYSGGLVNAFSKKIDYLNDEIKIMLVTSAYVPDNLNHVYKSSITNEVSGSGYTAGGVVLTSKTLNSGAFFDADDIVWTNATIVGARYAIIYDNTPAVDKPLIAYIDFGEDKTSSNGTFTLTFDSSGIMGIST